MPAVVIAKPDDEIADLIDRVRASTDPDVGPGGAGLEPSAADAAERSAARTVEQPIRPPNVDRHRGSSPPAAGTREWPPGVRIRPGVRARHRAGGPAHRRCGGWRGVSPQAPAALPPQPCWNRRLLRRQRPRAQPPAHPPASARLEPRRVLTQLPPARPPRADGIADATSTSPAPPSRFSASCCSWRSRPRQRSPSPSRQLRCRSARRFREAPARHGHTSRPRAHRRGHQYRKSSDVSGNSDRNDDASGGCGEGDPDVLDRRHQRHLVHTARPNNPSSYVQTADQSVTFGPARTTLICIGPRNPPPAGALLRANPYNATAPYVDVDCRRQWQRRHREV